MDRVVGVERKERWIFVLNKFQQGVGNILLWASLVLTSIWLFSTQSITVGDFVLMAAVLPSMTGIVWRAGDNVTHAVRFYGNLKNAVSDLQTEVERVAEGAATLPTDKTSVDFQDVSFTYPGIKEPVFNNLSLYLKEGERVGIVGPSGAGKSTLIKLILRQYDPGKGSVRIGNTNIREVTLQSLRQAIAFVPQDTSLFHRTLYENIQYAKPNASEAEIIAASKKAHAHEFIEANPKKYQTVVGERGVKLSGGQRQRIAIARAMLKDAPILVLDEATSALDSESEEIVQKGLRELFKSRTVLAIAHRLSTLRSMDRIIVLHEGTIVEDGPPQELLNKERGVFKDMWEHQKSGFIS